MARDQQPDGAPELALLLPFYVNGTLSSDDRARVDAALADDADLRDELAAIQEIAALVQAGGAELTAPPADAAPARLQALLARIESEAPSRRTILPFRRRETASAPRTQSQLWRPAFAAALALAVIQAGVIGYQWTTTRGSGDYTVLSGPGATAAPATPRVILQFTPEARWSEIETLLASQRLTVAGGPSGGQIEASLAAGGKVDETVQALRASPLVTFAGPVS